MAGRDLSLHVVSDAFRVRLNGVLGKADSRKLLSRHLPHYEFHEWDEATCSNIMTSCDLAVIPIDLGDPLVRGKSVNKLLLLWRMGMPVVAAATPAYREAMADVGTPELACASETEWIAAIERMMADEQMRREAADRGRRYAETRYGTEAILSRWDAMFASIGFDFGGQSGAASLKAAS
jgi:glycosyltransferase involved in cell wall biosynthesis